MRVLVTGASGFLGRQVVARLLARGDDVLVPGGNDLAAWRMGRPGVELVATGLVDDLPLRRAIARADAVLHLAPTAVAAAPTLPRRRLLAAAERGTAAVLSAAAAAGAERLLVATGVAVFGDTGGRAADESFPADRRTGVAAVDALQRGHALAVSAGATVVLPGFLYGPDDPSPLGLLLHAAARGFPPALVLPDLGLTVTHRDDAAEGVLAALDRGRAGRAYVLGGEPATLGRLAGLAAAAAGRPPQRLLPTAGLHALALAGPLLDRAAGLPPGLLGLLRGLDGRTCYARDDRARRELDYQPRSLDEGLAGLTRTLATDG